MEDLENNNLETMDGSPSLGAKPIKNFDFNDFPDIIDYLKAMESITTNSLKYLNNLYTANPYKIEDTTIAKLEKLERKIHLLETKILETISKDSDCQDKYNEYLNLHRNFMSNVLFSGETDAIIQNMVALNAILEQIPSVADWVQDRKEKLEAIAKLDGFITNERIVLRYKRILFQRRNFLYNSIYTKLVAVGENFERTSSNLEVLAELLNRQDDFAIYTFQALYKPVPAHKTMITAPNTTFFDFNLDDHGLDDDEKRKSIKTLIDGNDEERKNEVEKLKVKDDTSSITSLIEKKETDILRLKTKIEEDYEKLGDFDDLLNTPIEEDSTDEKMKELKQLRAIYLNEKDALEILKTLAELKKQGEKPKKNEEKERQKKIVEEWNKYMQQETGAAVGKLLYMAITGKTKNAEKLIESTIINLTKKTAVLFAQFISGPLAPFVGGMVDGFLGLLFEKEKEDPVLKGIGEIKEKLDKIEGKIDGLKNQIEAFQAEMTRMIDDIPEAVVAKIESSNLKTKINDLLSDISTKLLNSKVASIDIIENKRNETDKTDRTKDLIDHSSKVMDLIQKFLTSLYGFTSLNIDSYDIGEKPSGNSFLEWHEKESNSEHYKFDFYSEYAYLFNVLKNLKENIFERYLSVQNIVNEALEICYTMGDEPAYGTTIVRFLTTEKRIKDRQSKMFGNIESRLKNKMLGGNNFALFLNIHSYKNRSNQFDFTKAFGLQIPETKGTGKDAVESWHFCTYNYITKQLEKIQPDAKSNKVEHITRFFINPGFGRTYNLYCSNNDCRQTLIKAKVCLGLDDTINITLDGNKQHQTFRAVLLRDTAFTNSVDHLFATNGYVVLPNQGETILQMPLNGFKLLAECKGDEKGLLKCYVSFIKEKGNTREEAEIFSENIDPQKFKGGVILKFDYATLSCSLGTLDGKGKLDANVGIEVFSFKPKEGLETNNLYATNWKLQSKSGYPLNIDNRYLVSYLNEAGDSLETVHAKLVMGQSLYKNEVIFTDRYKMLYSGNGYLSVFAYNNFGSATEESLVNTVSISSDTEVLVMQGDHVFVAYNKDGASIWTVIGTTVGRQINYIQLCEDGVINSKANGSIVVGFNTSKTKTDLKPAEYLKRGEYIYYELEDSYKLGVLLTTEGDLTIIQTNDKNESITGMNAHYLKMGLDGTLALYDDKKNILKQIKAGQGNVKFAINVISLFAGVYHQMGCFIENKAELSEPIKKFRLSDWT